ncbi:cytochrome P450 [Comamonas sp. J-3]|uniref:cytochrome P450 n=1 Tax=Comamonas trifloxystrobinivorans TaxID=3350256 RepID=UPI00372BFA76
MQQLKSGSDCCAYVYEQARTAPGRNSVLDSDGQRVLVIQNWQDADRIMRVNMANYPKNLRWLEQIAGSSRVTEEGQAWRFRRSLSQAAFSRYDEHKAATVSARHAQNIAQALARSASAVLDEQLIHREVFAIFTEMFLELDAQDIPMHHRSATQLVEWASQYAFVTAKPTAGRFSREQLRDILQLKNATTEALQCLRSQPQPAPMLAKMLEAEQHEAENFRMEREIVTLMGAGTDTVTYSIGWALYLLAQNPKLQERLHAAIAQIYAEHSDVVARQQALGACPELKYFLSELLRIYPPVPFVTRRAQASDQLSDLQVQADDAVVVSLVGINEKTRDRANPWLPDIDAARQEGHGPGTSTHTSFIWGPRVCAGRNFAMLELGVVLAELVQQLRFEVSEPAAIELEWVGQMRRKGGHRIRVGIR